MQMTDPAFAAFVRLLRQAVLPLEPDARVVDVLAAACDVQNLGKGDHLLRMGDVTGHIYFVVHGLLRYYHLDPASGEERTGQFFDETRVFTEAASFMAQVPATQSIQALEPAQVLRVPRDALYAAYAADHAVERFGRLMVEEALVGSQRRATNLLTLSPDERYRTFVAVRPEVARRVPQYLIASYLGITPEALSRIRGRLARKPTDRG